MPAALRLLLCRRAAASAGAEHVLLWDNLVSCYCESSKQARGPVAAVLEFMRFWNGAKPVCIQDSAFLGEPSCAAAASSARRLCAPYPGRCVSSCAQAFLIRRTLASACSKRDACSDQLCF